MSVLLALLVIGAAYRLTRLITADYVTAAIRGWLVRRYGDNRLAYFITCDWCVGFWIAWGPAALAVFWPTNRVVWLVLLALSASTVVGLAASRLEGE